MYFMLPPSSLCPSSVPVRPFPASAWKFSTSLVEIFRCAISNNTAFASGCSLFFSSALKNILGHLAYVMEGAKRIFDVKTYHLCVEANGEVHEGDYIYGMITNSHSIGGFRNLVGNDVEMDDGLFEVTLIKKPKNPLELNEIIAALINAYDDTEMIDAFKANSLYIHGDEAISWTLDGEFGGEHKEVRIKNRKQALDILINS